jgi:hypothetical protein
VVPTKGIQTSDFVVRSWGLPSKRRPKGAVKVLYGPTKLPYRKLKSSMRTVPMEKLLTVELGEDSSNNFQYPMGELSRSATSQCDDIPFSKIKGQTKKNLLDLKPWRYFKAMSDPKFELRGRAVLQSCKRSLYNVWELMELSLKEIQSGDASKAKQRLHFLKHCFKSKIKWSLYDHLMHRYIYWCIGVLKSAKQVLVALGLTSFELRNPLLKNYGKKTQGSLRPSRLFVTDK